MNKTIKIASLVGLIGFSIYLTLHDPVKMWDVVAFKLL